VQENAIHPDAALPCLSSTSNTPTTSGILSSWKEIAVYLGRGVRTVQRWEQQLALPVRHTKGDHGTVYAFRQEIDSWLSDGKTRPDQSLRAENERLRERIVELTIENEQLRKDIRLKRIAA
jgi:phage terminase Nu1 subunit (DNA packaging protein)